MGDVTQLLEAAQRGEDGATRELFTLVYEELKAIAHGAGRGRPDRPLGTTELVHECFIRLAGGPEAKNRGHFYALAARAMRQILCDQARRALAAKRGGGAAPTGDVEVAPAQPSQAEELVNLDRLLTALAEADPRAAQVMDCRVFGGFTAPETAEALGVSERTVFSDFERARQWLATRVER
jgi:RNA polymerase sigma factor (TIGR02999 family)